MFYRSLLVNVVSFMLYISTTYAQKYDPDTTSYLNRFVLYNDVGINNAPLRFKLRIKANTSTYQLYNNLHDFYAIGCHYKWFALRLSSQLLGSNEYSQHKGKSSYFRMGVDFNYKHFHFDIDLHEYRGFSNGKSKFENLKTNNVSFNTWYFFKNNFSMSALKGKTATFNRFTYSPYIKSTINIYGVNNENSSILPYYLMDSTNLESLCSSINAKDLGLIPGLALANKTRNWHYNLMIGFGAVLQEQKIEIEKKITSRVILEPRFDLRIMGGYNKNRWFIMLNTELDAKSIRYSNFKYEQYYINLRLVYGYRFGVK